MVLARGDRDAGTILVLTIEKGMNARIFERMPQPDGSRKWHLAYADEPEKPQKSADIIAKRRASDPDLWVIELDIANGERFIGLTGTID